MSKKPIVFFDSGLGGVSALKEAVQVLPAEDFIFFGDTQNVPYGTKSIEEIRELVFHAMEKIMKYEPKAIILACNTATSAAAKDLRAYYTTPILGMEPAIKPALVGEGSGDKKVLMISTELTAKAEKLTNLRKKVDPEGRLEVLPMPSLVELAEELKFDGPEVIQSIQGNFAPYDLNEFESMVLGCTHFIWFLPVFKEILPSHLKYIDGNYGTIQHLIHILGDQLESDGPEGKIQVHFSGGLSMKVQAFIEHQLGRRVEVIEEM